MSKEIHIQKRPVQVELSHEQANELAATQDVDRRIAQLIAAVLLPASVQNEESETR